MLFGVATRKRCKRAALVGLGLLFPLFCLELGLRSVGLPLLEHFQVRPDGTAAAEVYRRTDLHRLPTQFLLCPDGLKEKVTLADENGLGFYRLDAELGWALGTSVPIRHLLRQGDPLVYDITFRLDDRGRRRTPGPAESDQTLHFLGGSFCFGSGVNDEQTLPARCAELTGWKALNYGVPGYGPHQVLRQLETLAPEEVAPGSHHFIYVLIPEHLSRASGGFPNYSHGLGPCYEVNSGSQELQWRGSFAQAHPWRTAGLNLLGCSRAARAFVRWREGRSEGEVLLTTAILQRCQEVVKERFRGRFSVVIYPELQGRPYPPDLVEELSKTMTEAGLRVLRYPQAAAWGEGYFLPLDYHPSAGAHERLAGLLAADMEIPAPIRDQGKRSPARRR